VLDWNLCGTLAVFGWNALSNAFVAQVTRGFSAAGEINSMKLKGVLRNYCELAATVNRQIYKPTMAVERGL
jgi:hypothetical protein